MAFDNYRIALIRICVKNDNRCIIAKEYRDVNTFLRRIMCKEEKQEKRKKDWIKIIQLVTVVITTIAMPTLGFFYDTMLNNTFEVSVEVTEKNGLGTSYTVYELNTDPALQNAKLGLQGYAEVIYKEKKLATILVNDLYGNSAYQIENGKVEIICKERDMGDYCEKMRDILVEQCGMDESQLVIRYDTIIGFKYTVLHQNFIISRYFRLNGNQPLHISKHLALQMINEMEGDYVFMEGTLAELSEDRIEDVVTEIKKAML